MAFSTVKEGVKSDLNTAVQADTVALKAPRLSRENWLILSSLYVSVWLPMGFIFVALVAIMRQQGTPLEQISILYTAGIFWAVKFLWAPFIDKWRLGFLGHYRGWSILVQLGLILSLFAMSRLDVANDFPAVIAISMIIGFLSAVLDAAASALAYRLLPAENRGFGNSLQASGALIGNLFGAGVILMLYPVIGWENSVYLLIFGVLISLVLTLRFKEEDFEYHHPSVRESTSRFISFWRRPKGAHWFLLLAIYPLGLCLAWPLITPMLVDVKWQLDEIGFVVNVIGSAVGIGGAMVSGWLIKRYGRRRMVITSLILQIPATQVLLLIINGYTDYLSVTLIVSALFIGYSPVKPVIFTLMMDHASHKHPATDIALQYSLFNVFVLLASTVSTAMAGFFGYTSVLIAVAVILLIALTISYKYPFKEYRNE